MVTATLAVAASCKGGCERLDSETPAQRASRERARGRSPMSPSELPSLDPKLALTRLDESIAESEAQLAGGDRIDALASGAANLLLRGYMLGRISDLERGTKLAARAIEIAPDDPRGYLRLAQAEIDLRRFPEASQHLDEAEKRGCDPAGALGTRARIHRNLGHYDEVIAILAAHNADAPDIYSLATEAIARGAKGERDQADTLFARAQHLLPDSSPFPLAWLYYQQGLMWSAAGKTARAIELLTASLQRFPQFPRAAAALAPLLYEGGKKDEAIALLRPIAETTEDPECAGILSDLLDQSGKSTDADRWRTLAGARYDALYAAHPELLADRAATFWLKLAREPAKALAPALKAFEVYGTAEMLTLALEASFATNDAASTCQLAMRAPALGPRLPATMLPLVERAKKACTTLTATTSK